MRVLFVTLLMTHAVQAQPLFDLFGTDTFHCAYSVGTEIRFDPFQELAWEGKARAALPDLNLDRPTAAQIARLATFESAGPLFRSADFRAPLDPLVGRATYLLLSDAGVVDLQPVQLQGSISFFFNEEMTAVEHRAITGTVVGKASRPVGTAAFAVMGKPSDVTDIHPGAKFEKPRQGNAGIYAFTDQGRTVAWTTSERDQPEAASAMSFRLAGKQYLLVKWKGGVCESEYTLFTVGAVLTPIAGNGYDCDA